MIMDIIIGIVVTELAILFILFLCSRKPCGCNGLYSCRDCGEAMVALDDEQPDAE